MVILPFGIRKQGKLGPFPAISGEIDLQLLLTSAEKDSTSVGNPCKSHTLSVQPMNV